MVAKFFRWTMKKIDRLYLKEVELEEKLPVSGLVEKEHMLDVLLDYCSRQLDKEMKRRKPDSAYINECMYVLGKYTPEHERLLGLESGALKDKYRDQLDSVYSKLTKSGEI